VCVCVKIDNEISSAIFSVLLQLLHLVNCIPWPAVIAFPWFRNLAPAFGQFYYQYHKKNSNFMVRLRPYTKAFRPIFITDKPSAWGYLILDLPLFLLLYYILSISFSQAFVTLFSFFFPCASRDPISLATNKVAKYFDYSTAITIKFVFSCTN